MKSWIISVVTLQLVLVSVTDTTDPPNDVNHCCKNKSDCSSQQWQLPCLCPKEKFDKTKYYKSLCPAVGSLKEIKLVKGENATFHCDVVKRFGKGVPYHCVIRMWWCNGTEGSECYTSQQAPYRTPRTYFTYSQSDNNSTKWNLSFSITNADKRDENTYTCVSNTEELDYTKTPGYRSIHVSVNDGVTPTLIKQPPRSINKEEGRMVELYCDSQGYPDITVRWVKDGKHVNISKSITIIQHGSQSVLRIQQISKDDEGGYQCIAYNQVGFIESVGTRVTIMKRKVLPRVFLVVCLAVAGFISGVVLTVVYVRHSRGKGNYETIESAKAVDGCRTPTNSHSYSPLPSNINDGMI